MKGAEETMDHWLLIWQHQVFIVVGWSAKTQKWHNNYLVKAKVLSERDSKRQQATSSNAVKREIHNADHDKFEICQSLTVVS